MMTRWLSWLERLISRRPTLHLLRMTMLREVVDLRLNHRQVLTTCAIYAERLAQYVERDQNLRSMSEAMVGFRREQLVKKLIEFPKTIF